MYKFLSLIVMFVKSFTVRSFTSNYNIRNVYNQVFKMDISKTINNELLENCTNKLFFDTETNGLPITKGFDKYYSARETKYYDNSRLLEIGYIIYNNKNKKIKEVCHLIK